MADPATGSPDTPGVTAVIPAHNMERYLERTVRSALAQSYPALEVLVINDASTDSTRMIVERIAAEAHRPIDIVTIPHGGVARARNTGVARARNTGVERARTPWVAFLDGDDLWHPDKIARQIASLRQRGWGDEWVASYTGYRMIDIEDRVLLDGPLDLPSGAFLAEHLIENHVNNGSSVLVRRDVALQVGGFDPTHAEQGRGGCEDYDFQLKLLQGFKIDCVPARLVGYRSYRGNMSSNHLPMARGLLSVIERHTAAPRVSPAVRRRARGQAHAKAAARFFKAREWSLMAAELKAIAASDPSRAPALIARLAGRAAGQWLQGGVWAVQGAVLRDRGEPAPRFDELDPG